MKDISNFYELAKNEQQKLMKLGSICIDEQGNIVSKGEPLKRYMEDLMPCAYCYLKNIMRDIKNAELPYVMSIEGGFGSGKTHFVTRLCQYIRDQGVKSIYFNAFEYDSIHPKVAVLDAIFKSENLGVVEKFFKKLVNRLNIAFSIPFLGISFSMAQNGLYFKDEMEKIKSLLQEEISKKGKLVLIIDELDRCDPRFGLNLLETIKHFFDLGGLFVILSFCDKVLLSSLAHSYGTMFSEQDSENYLTKFIDHRTKIYGIDENSYILAIKKFFGKTLISDNDLKDVAFVFYKLKLSVRELKRNVERIINILRFNVIDETIDFKLISYITCRYDHDFEKIEGVVRDAPDIHSKHLYQRQVIHDDWLGKAYDITRLRKQVNVYYEIICRDSENAKKLTNMLITDLINSSKKA